MKRNDTHRQRRVYVAKKVGLARYRREQWARWLALVDDRETWVDTYEEWLADAEAMAERLRRAGLEVNWVDLEAEAFAAWCKSRGYKNDAEARSRFAAEQIGNIPSPAATS